MFTIREVIDLAIQIERNAEEIYRNGLQKTSNQSIYKLLQRLADEEVKHVEWFSELKQEVKGTTVDPELEEMGKSVLANILGDQAFSLRDVDVAMIVSIKDLFNLAIEFEKDTVIFYKMIASLIEDAEALNHLYKIIEEESNHIKLFQKLLDGGDFEMNKNMV